MSFDQTTELLIAIRNSSLSPIVVYIEPWAEEYPLAAGSVLTIIGRGPEKGSGFLVDYEEKAVTVSAWSGSTVRVFSEGKELGDVGHRPIVPYFE